MGPKPFFGAQGREVAKAVHDNTGPDEQIVGFALLVLDLEYSAGRRRV